MKHKLVFSMHYYCGGRAQQLRVRGLTTVRIECSAHEVYFFKKYIGVIMRRTIGGHKTWQGTSKHGELVVQCSRTKHDAAIGVLNDARERGRTQIGIGH